MRAPTGLHLDYLSPAEYRSARRGDVLGVASFNGLPAGSAGGEIPVAQVSTPVLEGTAHLYEVWRCDLPATSGQRQGVRFRRTADTLFGCIAVTEEAQVVSLAASAAGGARHGAVPTALHAATTRAYREI